MWRRTGLRGDIRRSVGKITPGILTHHKNLNVGDYLIDDRTKHGVPEFSGEHIHFGTEEFPDWRTVTAYLRPLAVQRI